MQVGIMRERIKGSHSSASCLSLRQKEGRDMLE